MASEKRCGTCLWIGYPTYPGINSELRRCHAPLPKLANSLNVVRVSVKKSEGTDCPTFERKEPPA